MTTDTLTALTAADLLDKAADRIEAFGWYVGEGWYSHSLLETLRKHPAPPTQRAAWGRTHLYFAAGVPIPHWKTGPDSVPAAVREAEQQLVTHILRFLSDDERAENADGYIDVDAQLEAFEADRGMTAGEVAETFRDCAVSIRAKHTTPAETKVEAA